MKLLVATALLALATPFAAHAQSAESAITAGLADPSRPEADRARDASRHPAEVLAFAGVKPGDKVGDFVMGGGYWSRIVATAVGPNGHVYGYQPAEFAKYADPNAKPLSDTYANVTVSMVPGADFAFPEPLDIIFTFENWHDLHTPAFATPDFGKVAARKLYDSLKPGGVLIVADHVANADPGMKAPDTLHRIDPAAARADVESAGFVYDGELPVLRNPADDHSLTVFDKAIRGKTDQFVYRFRKP
ncbi:MAG: class I SAM-dependent methyltransferase [Sphingomonas sp.]|uniref:class I SAM-dependent methyltransferase n=1 Tax=Sphingomonas sp. TaxID=28214 RepID=UPI0025D5DC2A|nr:methyltransferase [Sphingomonas sp.]MBX3566164.1 class I SAM-dependent methyltransferase [Sphingomonas sp.]